MLEITVNLNSYFVKMSGHANYAEKGRDIVCSAGSILFYSLCETLGQYENGLRDKPKIEIDIDGESGIKAFVSCRPKNEYELNIYTVFFTIANGFKLLANGYPENVKLKIIE